MADIKKAKARAEGARGEEVISAQWKFFKEKCPDAYEDLMLYIDGQREMFRKYAEERAMPHPDPQMEGRLVPIDNEMVASLLQNSRGLNIIRSYIAGRIDSDVAPTKTTK